MALILYLDSSALVKLVFEEAGTREARELWDTAARAFSSRLAYVETRAALAAAARGGRMTSPELRAARRHLDRYTDEMDEIDVDGPTSRFAGDLAERYRLRGGDSVHLATALSMRADDVVFATWDRELAMAADNTGLRIAPAS